jgi:hypothetical protein
MGEGMNITESIRRITVCEKSVLGPAFLGTGAISASQPAI